MHHCYVCIMFASIFLFIIKFTWDISLFELCWSELEWALEFFQRNVLLHVLTVKTLDKEQKVQVKSSSRVSVHSQMKKLLFRRSMRSINVIGMSLTTYVDWCWLASVVNLQLYFVQLVMIGGWFVEVLITDFVPTHATFWV